MDVEVVKQRIAYDHLRQDKAHRREQRSSIAKAQMPLLRLLAISQGPPPRNIGKGQKQFTCFHPRRGYHYCPGVLVRWD